MRRSTLHPPPTAKFRRPRVALKRWASPPGPSFSFDNSSRLARYFVM
jgi:hypothetical protein